MKRKIVVAPGWMDRAWYHCGWEGLDIWTKNIKPENRIDAEYVAGHSIGALFALQNWKCNKNTKIILINPLLPKRSLIRWTLRFMKFLFNEPLLDRFQRSRIFLHIVPFGLIKLYKLIQIDPLEIIDKIPQKNLIVVYGENDNYFCDEECRNILEKRGVQMIEVKGVGHNWHRRFNEILTDIAVQNDITQPACYND